MEFGSSFVACEKEEDVTVHLDADENQWADASQIFAQSTPAPGAEAHESAAPPPVSAKPSVIRKNFRKKTTNVLALDFAALATGAELATGDAVCCKQCNAVLNCHSKLEHRSSSSLGDHQIWKCEFCSAENEIQCAPEEIPTGDGVDYIVAPPPSAAAASEDDQIVVFCVDCSGSMCTSYEINGAVQLRGHEKLARLRSTLDIERNQFGQEADQRLPNERAGVTYVTRLQCVQAAISAQLDAVVKDNPKRRVGLVTFNNDVTVFGDGSADPKTITGDRLSNFEELVRFGADCNQLSKCIKDSKESLSQRLFSLEEGGSTALGPALLTCVSLCARAPGSKIVLCTDGLANVGLGSLDDLVTEQDKDDATAFYEQVGQMARANGTAVSVVSIRGTDCSIENLGKVVEMTGGDVDRVEATEIAKNFQSILSLPVLATGVKVTVLLHQGLFVHRDGEDLQKSSNLVDIGNVTAESTLTLEYGVRPSFAQDELRRVASLPFQVQISYTRPDGMRCMRVLTKNQPITFDRAQAEEAANVHILSRNAVQQTARIAAMGDYAGARISNLAHKAMLKRVTPRTAEQQAVLAGYEAAGEQFEQEFSAIQRSERAQGYQDAFAEENDDEEQKVRTSKARSSARDDKSAEMLLKMKKWRK